jgi:hypothetical protein
MARRRALATFAAFAFSASTCAPTAARADDAASASAVDPPAPRDEPGKDAPTHDDGGEGGVRVGVLGGLGFPRPLALEAVVGLGRRVMVGAEYSFLPSVTISSVKTRMWAGAADLRVFPFGGAFFVGMRAGYQSVTAETTLSAANVGSYTESADVGTWFVNPRIGFLWTMKPFAIGIDAGVQIPLSTTVSRSSLLALAAPSVDAQVSGYADMLGRTPLPTIDLLRLGLVF